MCQRPDITCVGDQDRPDVRLEDPSDAQGVAGRLERNVIIGAKALREQLQLLKRAGNTARRSDLAVLIDRDVAEVAMDVQTDEAQADLLSRSESGNRRARTTQTDSGSQPSRASRKGGHR